MKLIITKRKILNLIGAIFLLTGLVFIAMSLLYGNAWHTTYEQAGKSFFSCILGFVLMFSSFIFLTE